MGCRRIFPELFEDYGIRDSKWTGDLKYYIVRQCLGYTLNMDDIELSLQVSPDTDIVNKFKMDQYDWKSWFEFIFYVQIQFELLNPISESLIFQLRTLRQVTNFVLKNYSDELIYIKNLQNENPDEAKFHENELKGRLNASKFEQVRKKRFNKLIKNPLYIFFHKIEQNFYPKIQIIPEIRYLNSKDFSGFFKSYQKYYKRYRHISIKYRWQIKKAYQKRHAKYLGYEIFRKMIAFRKTYYQSSWDINYMSYHDYISWLKYLKKSGAKYELEYQEKELIKRTKRKHKKRVKGINGGHKNKLGEPHKFYCGTYLRNHKEKYLKLNYRFFDPPKKKYDEYPI